MPKFKRLNQRQELFAQGVAAGLSGVDAFKRATSGNPKDCDVKASQMRGQPGVEERIKELMCENGKLSQLTREQTLAFLAQVITTGAGDVDPHSALCQSHKHTSGDGWEAHEVRIPDKIGAIAALCRMTGWNEPERLELGASSSLTQYLSDLRAEREPLSAKVIEIENGSREKRGAHE